MYSGLLVMILGAAVLIGTPGALVVVAATTLGFSLKANQEERWLSQHFPQEYAGYKKRTKAIIPFLL
jgi:protein-S-isoprenylcysteine O-methyltransferase Ste14